jgi:hypothetical protein
MPSESGQPSDFRNIRRRLLRDLAGLYGVDVMASDAAPGGGTPIERTDFLAIETQPQSGPGTLVWISLAVGWALIVAAGVWVIRGRRARG